MYNNNNDNNTNNDNDNDNDDDGDDDDDDDDNYFRGLITVDGEVIKTGKIQATILPSVLNMLA